MSVVVNWNGNRFDVPFPEAVSAAAREGNISNRDAWAKKVTLGDLLAKCSQGSKVPISSIKLLHSGSVMKDPNMSLAQYGIRTGSKIMMIGDNSAPLRPPPEAHHRPTSGTRGGHGGHAPQNHQHSHAQQPAHGGGGTRQPQPQSRQPPTPQPPSTSSPAPSSRSGTPQQDQNKPPAVDMKNEDSVVNLIDFHMDYITTTVMPIVEEYVAKATEYLETGDITTTDTASRPASAESGTTPNAPKKLADLHAKAAELLLQRLLKIDAVELEPGFDRARSRRREAVRFVQGQLDKIDGIKERVKAAVASKKGLL